MNNNVLPTSINLLYFGYRWKVLEMNMEQQGLTEEEVCVIPFPVESFRHSC